MSDDYIVQTSDRRIRTARTGGETREINAETDIKNRRQPTDEWTRGRDKEIREKQNTPNAW